jgi:hypothetical protein
MRLHVRAGLAVVAAGVLLVVLTSATAGAQGAPTINVTPSAGLIDGQTVTVTGTGFDTTAEFWAGSVCAAEVLAFLPSSPSQLDALCGADSYVRLTRNATGRFSTTMTVYEVQPTFTGGPVDCEQSSCIILFVGVGPSLTWASIPIAFGSPTPQVKADCKPGGWHNYANDQGQPFRNQGQCVSFVVTHRP